MHSARCARHVVWRLLFLLLLPVLRADGCVVRTAPRWGLAGRFHGRQKKAWRMDWQKKRRRPGEEKREGGRGGREVWGTDGGRRGGRGTERGASCRRGALGGLSEGTLPDMETGSESEEEDDGEQDIRKRPVRHVAAITQGLPRFEFKPPTVLASYDVILRSSIPLHTRNASLFASHRKHLLCGHNSKPSAAHSLQMRI